MKKDHIILIKSIYIFLFLILIQLQAVADDFLLPNFNFYRCREFEQISKNAEQITFERIRNKYDFENYFDKQSIVIYKQRKDFSPKNAGDSYFARTLEGDKTAEKYILQDEENFFQGLYCSQKLAQCEIVKYVNGYEGLIEIKYTHNNIWHFQNNIGSFLEIQNRIKFYPSTFLLHYVTNEKYLIRLTR
jgi:hypothetical protein